MNNQDIYTLNHICYSIYITKNYRVSVLEFIQLYCHLFKVMDTTRGAVLSHVEVRPRYRHQLKGREMSN